MALSFPPLYNIEIDEFLSRYDLPHYIGVFSSNTIPKLPRKCVFICNLSNDYQTGTHFITICRINKELIILDSLALNMANSMLLRKLRSIAKTVSHLQEPIQSIKSQSCGLFCIFFVLLFHRDNISRDILQFNKHNLRQNDIICAQNVKLLLSQVPLKKL